MMDLDKAFSIIRGKLESTAKTRSEEQEAEALATILEASVRALVDIGNYCREQTGPKINTGQVA